MNDQVLESLISQFLAFRFKESIFGWQGGEPTLAGLDFFKKVVNFQQKYGQPGQTIGNAFQTNGLLINEEWTEFFEKYRFLIGLSLDGPPSIHDRYRKTIGGKSVWQKVMNAIDILRNYHVEFNILCVISKANVNRVKELYHFFIDNELHYLQFIPALESDENGKRSSFSISPLQYGKFLCELFDEWKKTPQDISIRLFDGILSSKLGLPKGICTFEKVCADYLLVESNGDIYPCDFFVHDKFKIGNILREDLGSLKIKRDNHFGKLKENVGNDCIECKWLDSCYGGCIKDRMFSDNPHPEKTLYCDAYKQFFEYSNDWFSKFASTLR